MKIIKLIVCEEHLLGNGKNEAYRRQKDIYNMEGKLIYSFDPFNKELEDGIKDVFN